MDSNTPQLRPSESESRSMDSTTPQLRSSETESRSSDSTMQPNLNLQLQPATYEWTSETKVIRREDGMYTIQLPPDFFNLQEEESMQLPLGLKLEITPELLTEYWKWKLALATGKPFGHPPGIKASTIPATSISIGPNWRKESRREDHLTLKLYFAKKKLIWEFLEGSLKEKIEVSWSDIIAIKAHYLPRDQPGILLRIQLGKAPSFFREFQPKPGKHTTWEKTTDFTHGHAASHHWIYEAKFGEGVLVEHYAKLMLSDQRLLELSMHPFPANPNPTQGDQSSTTAPCLQQQTLTTSVNNPTPSTAAAASTSQSHLGGVGERPFHMQMQGESSSSSSRINANQLHQTPLLMPWTPQQRRLPLSFTGVEPYNNPTPSIAASPYLNPAMTVGRFPSMGSSSRNADHHQTPFLALGDHSQPLAEFNQVQNNNNNHSHINVPANSCPSGLYYVTHGHQPTLGSTIYGGEQWQELGYNNYFGSGLMADPEQARPELDGDGNTGNDSMDLNSIIRSANINRRPT